MRSLLLVCMLSMLLLPGISSAAQNLDVDAGRYLDAPGFLGYVPDRFIVVLNDNVAVDHAADARSPIALSHLPKFSETARAQGVVRLQPEFPGSDRAAVANNAKGRGLARFYKVFIENGDLDAAMAAYARLPEVERVEPIGIHTVSAVPNDTYYDNPPPTYPYDQWHYWDTYGIDADLAWNDETGDPQVLVGVLDTGVKYDHGDLGGSDPPGPDDPVTNGNIWVNSGEIAGNGTDDDGNGYVDDVIGWDFVDRTDWYTYSCVDLDCGGADNDPFDGNGHGTHVAGTIAAITNNGYAVSGIAGGWGDGTFAGGSGSGGVKVVPCRIGYTLSYMGQDLGVVIMDYVAEAMYYMADLKTAGYNVASINCSFGSSNSGGLGAAADYLIAQDVMIVVAAGNSNSSSPDYLGSRGDCMDVGATNQAGDPASFSNYGSWVDVAAPGEGIMSTTTDPADPSADYVAVFDGTSMAAPHVAGVAALLESFDPSLSSVDKRNLILTTASPYNQSKDVGVGIVNVRNAMDAVGPGCDLAADFTANAVSGCAPLAVNFSDLSTGTAIDGWSWDFGDGGTSTAQNPSYSYGAPGTYTVSLTVSSSSQGCDDTATRTGYITVTDGPTADFAGSPVTGTAPLTVNFSDLSIGDPVSWSWDFGDGGTSTAQNPSHVYSATGVYTVSLAVTSACGTDAVTKTDYVTVTEPGAVSYAYATGETSVDGAVSGSFADTYASDDVRETITEVAYTGHPRKTYSFLEHRWSFTVSAGSAVTFHLEASRTDNADGDDFVFAYSTDGATWIDLVTVASAAEQVYEATLPANLSGAVTVRVIDTDRSWGNSSMDAVAVDEMYIATEGAGPVPPVAAFSGTPTSGAPPLAVQFTDLSTGDPTSWSWDFGDGGTSTAQNPGHTYASAGTYTVTLTVSNAYGSDAETKPGYITAAVSANEMYVYDVVVLHVGAGGGTSRGEATVTIFTDTNQPLAGATVTGDFTGLSDEPGLTAVTDANGQAVLTTATALKARGGEWCFEVTDVTHPSYTYNPTMNLVTASCAKTGDLYGGSRAKLPLSPELKTTANAEIGTGAALISFNLPQSERVRVEVFDVAGRRLDVVVDRPFGAGLHTVSWNAEGRPSGVYFYRVVAGREVTTNKLVLLK